MIFRKLIDKIKSLKTLNSKLVLSNSGIEFENYCRAIIDETDIVNDEFEKLLQGICCNLAKEFNQMYTRKEVAEQVVEILEIIPRENDYEW